MPLPVVCCYTYRTSSVPPPWTDPEASVVQFVNALKERKFRGYGHVLVQPGQPKVKIDNANGGVAARLFGTMAAGILCQAGFARSPLRLVPVPNSGCVVGSVDARTKRLASEVARHSGGIWQVADVLRWTEEMQSANEHNGPRRPELLYPYLVSISRLDVDVPHILIDDVLTSGGHLQAAAAVLRDADVDPELAICGARADDAPQADPFARRHDQLADFRP